MHLVSLQQPILQRLTSNSAFLPLAHAGCREMLFLSAEQVGALADAMVKPYDTLVYVLAYGGLRWGEAIALRRGRCDLLHSTLHVRESLVDVDRRLILGATKTYANRAVSLPPFLRLASRITSSTMSPRTSTPWYSPVPTVHPYATRTGAGAIGRGQLGVPAFREGSASTIYGIRALRSWCSRELM